MSEEQVEVLFEQAEKNGDGKIDATDFVALATSLPGDPNRLQQARTNSQQNPSQQGLANQANAVAAAQQALANKPNGDGMLDLQELKRGMKAPVFS